jgi:hypothetical protein
MGAEIKTGDKLRLTCDGRTVAGWVIMASPNGRSLAVGFEAILLGHVGVMPLLQEDDGVYRALIGGEEVGVEIV